MEKSLAGILDRGSATRSEGQVDLSVAANTLDVARSGRADFETAPARLVVEKPSEAAIDDRLASQIGLFVNQELHCLTLPKRIGRRFEKTFDQGRRDGSSRNGIAKDTHDDPLIRMDPLKL